jgi:hypothetical protein
MAFTVDQTTFGGVAAGIGLYDLGFDPDAVEEDLTVYHVKGVRGAYSSCGGTQSRLIRCTVRSTHSTHGNALRALTQFAEAVKGRSFRIVGPDQRAYARCRLRTVRVLARTGTGRAGLNTGRVSVDARLVFLCMEG